jgi:hypothetical protein
MIVGVSSIAFDWIEFGHVALDGDENKRIAVCRRAGSAATKVFDSRRREIR